MRNPGTPTRGTKLPFLLMNVLLLVALLLAACQPAAPAAPTAAPTAAPKPAAPTAAPAAPAATAAPAAAAKTVTVKIGFQPAYTGPVAVNSETQSQGVADYFQSVNDAGGVPYKDPKTGETINAKLEVVWEDNAYDTPRMLSIYTRQKAAGVKGMVTYGTASAVALAEAASKDKMPFVVLGAPSEAVLKPTPRYVTTMMNPYDMQTKSFLKWAKDNWKESRPPRLGIVYHDIAAGQIAISGVDEFAKKLGWEVLPKEVFTEPVTDASIQVKRLMGGKPDWVFAILTAGATAVVIKDAARLGLKDPAKWVGITYAFDPPSYQKVAAAETDGTMGWLYWSMETETNQPGVAEAAAAAQKYRKTALSNLYLQGWAVGKVFTLGGIKGALDKVGNDALTTEAVNTALHSMKGLDTGGIFPPVNTTDDEPFVISKARLVQWKDGKINVLTDWQVGALR